MLGDDSFELSDGCRSYIVSTYVIRLDESASSLLFCAGVGRGPKVRPLRRISLADAHTYDFQTCETDEYFSVSCTVRSEGDSERDRGYGDAEEGRNRSENSERKVPRKLMSTWLNFCTYVLVFQFLAPKNGQNSVYPFPQFRTGYRSLIVYLLMY